MFVLGVPVVLAGVAANAVVRFLGVTVLLRTYQRLLLSRRQNNFKAGLFGLRRFLSSRVKHLQSGQFFFFGAEPKPMMYRNKLQSSLVI